MSTVLVIKAHPHTSLPSLSVQVGDQFIKAYQDAHPDDQIIIRDLYTKEGVPPLNDVTMGAWTKQKMGQELTAEEKQTIDRHDAWLNEFVNADKYVFINPMYNHFLPAELKQYLDLTAVAHKTFKYTPAGAVGLLKGKKAIQIQAAGGNYHRNGQPEKTLAIKGNSLPDVGAFYLDGMMGFYGVTDVQHIFIDGAAQNPDQRQAILDRALDQAKKVAPNF